MTFKKLRKNILLDLPNNLIETSGFIAWIYIRLKNKIGQEKAFEILRAGILTSGFAIQQANFRNVEVQRNFENLKKYQQKANKEGSTKLNTMEVIEDSDTKYEFRVTRCLFYELFIHLEVPELTSIMCSIDNAIFNIHIYQKV